MSSLWDALGIPSTQVSIGLTTLVSHIVPLAVSYIAMAMLAITPRTRVFRAALWPILTLLTIRAAFVDWSFGKPHLVFINGELVRYTMCIPPHALSWAFVEKPLVRHLRPMNSSPSIIMDTLDLVTNLRGVGWDWSRGLYIPRDTRTRNRILFAAYAFFMGICNFMICGFIHQAIQMFVTNTDSLTVFDETLPFFVRYLRSSIITIMAAFVGYNGLQMWYHLMTTLGILFGQDPAQWPPGLDQPWYATSLTEFWSRRWHQWFRHTFIVCAYPFEAVLGRPGKVIGAFLASGLAHHLMVIPHNRHTEMWRMFVGFGMMAPGVLAERAFYKTTGRKVSGVLGWVWMVSWLVMWYSFAVEGFVRGKMYSLPRESEELTWIEGTVKNFDTWLHTI